MIKLNILDQETIKITNKKRIINLLYKKRELTKQDISKKLNISVPTIINNVNELIKEGILEEAGVGDSTGGRKPVIVKFISSARYSFGVEVKPHYVRIILVNLDSEIQYDKYFKMNCLQNFNKVLDKVEEEIDIAIKETKIERYKVLGVGFSLPGTVNEEKMLLEIAPNLMVKNICFQKFQSRINIPVYIENEANAAAYAEINLSIGNEMKNLVYISITEGIGVGVIVEDNLYKGKNKRAGEFGHMTIVPNGIECNCGRKGCWEMYVSERALLNYYNNNSTEKISLLKEFFNKLDNNEEIAIKVWKRYIDYLSIGIQNIILALDPHYVVVGGEISEYEDNLLNYLNEKVFIENKFYNEKDNRILLSKLKKDSSIKGAALLPYNKLFFLGSKII
ncbi:ROK family transcriptional regulator [Clostridium lundense]|uniref:ROK family transcriptional regulator n=1 Tax=Clostridium lundense TaxID=319475 RepID=UPI0004853B6F|nr:ROK family transcriptional regulator [Clostridium lundense]